MGENRPHGETACRFDQLLKNAPMERTALAALACMQAQAPVLHRHAGKREAPAGSDTCFWSSLIAPGQGKPNSMIGTPTLSSATWCIFQDGVGRLTISDRRHRPAPTFGRGLRTWLLDDLGSGRNRSQCGAFQDGYVR